LIKTVKGREKEMGVALNYVTLQQRTHYTYADYAKWEDSERYELIDGLLYMMAAPTLDHQRILGKLFRKLDTFLDGKRCVAFMAPFDVRLNAHTRDDTVVQPDVMVICDQSKLKNRLNCVGAPDLIIEILSPSSAKMDKVTKHKKYREAGVREYWIVDPEDETVSVNILDGGRYKSTVYFPEDTIPVHVLLSCEINLADIFPGAIIPKPVEAEPESPEEFDEEEIENLRGFLKSNGLKLADVYTVAKKLILEKTNAANAADQEE
jgi:Uma2 family endonuclease